MLLYESGTSFISTMIEVFKITHNMYDETVSPYLPLNIKANTRGNNYKLLNHSFHYDLRYFSARIVNIWNSLPNTVVDASTVNTFKSQLDKFWSHQLVKFDFTANLTGTGNRSGVDISWLKKCEHSDVDIEVFTPASIISG